MRRHHLLADTRVTASCLVMLAASQSAADQFLSIGSTMVTNLSEITVWAAARTMAPLAETERCHDVLRI